MTKVKKKEQCYDCYHNTIDAFIRDHGGEIKITGCEYHLRLVMKFYRLGQIKFTELAAEKKRKENLSRGDL